MTLFDKLTTIAQRARDNATAKMIINKDKRLEQSMLGGLGPDDLQLTQLVAYGLPGPVKSVAFDPKAGLVLAVGDRWLKVFGHSIAVTIPTPDNLKSIKHAQFHPGQQMLIVIDVSNVIYAIRLDIKRVTQLDTKRVITSCDLCLGTDWFFAGFSDGTVNVIDLERMVLSDYSIPCLLQANNTPTPHHPSLVVAVQTHPTDLRLLLVAYESAIFIWNVREQTVQQSYVSDPSWGSAGVTCVAWSPSGTRFAAGYDNGQLRIWDIQQDTKPITEQSTDLDHAGNMDGRIPNPVYRIAWYAIESVQRSFLVAACSKSDEPGMSTESRDGLLVFAFDLESDENTPCQRGLIPSPVDLVDFVVLGREAYSFGMRNPIGLLTVGIDGAVRAYNLEEEGYPPFKLPSAFSFVNPPADKMVHYSHLVNSTFQALSPAPTEESRIKPLPLEKGSAYYTEEFVPSNDILFTIHDQHQVRVWDATCVNLYPAPHLDVDVQDDVPDAIISTVHLNQANADLYVALSKGDVLVYQRIDTNMPIQALVDSSDQTLQELESLLDDINDIPDTETSTPSEHASPRPDTAAPSTASPTDRATRALPAPPIAVTALKCIKPMAGYYPALCVGTTNDPVTLMAECEHILAIATRQGNLYVIDLHSRHVVASLDIRAYCQTDTKADETDPTSLSSHAMVEITTLGWFNTYSSTKEQAVTILVVGLSNGQVYQQSLPYLSSGLSNVFRSSTQSPIVHVGVIDLEGRDQTAQTLVKASPDSPESEKTSTKPSATMSAPKRAASFLRRKPTPKPDVSGQTPSVSSQDKSDTSPSPSSSTGTAMWSDYQRQEAPHLVVIVSEQEASILLGGCAIRLYHWRLPGKEESVPDQILHGSVMSIPQEKSTWLVLLTELGRVHFLSLPDLKLLCTRSLHPNGEPYPWGLEDATLLRDGRFVSRSGAYEFQQVSVVGIHPTFNSDSVMFASQKRTKLPPRPMPTTTPTSWIAGVFHKEQKPWTVDDMNLQLGRPPVSAAAATATSSSSQGGSKAGGSAFAELTQSAGERGERLNELQQKFSDVNAASGDFLKAVRDYNERQANKKWWQL